MHDYSWLTVLVEELDLLHARNAVSYSEVGILDERIFLDD